MIILGTQEELDALTQLLSNILGSDDTCKGIKCKDCLLESKSCSSNPHIDKRKTKMVCID